MLIIYLPVPCCTCYIFNLKKYHFSPVKAKEMVAISKSIATKIKDKQGDVTDDEVGICENIMKRKSSGTPYL